MISFVENLPAIKLSFASAVTAVGGFIVGFLGGIDSLLITLVTLIVVDYITGVVRAIYKKELSSAVTSPSSPALTENLLSLEATVS